MQSESTSYNAIDFFSSTATPMPLEEISYLFSKANLESEFVDLYAYIVEVVSNIYQHAVGNTEAEVSWGLAVSKCKGSVEVSISDNGQGVFSSISKRASKRLSKLEALAFALNQRGTAAHRGKGLQDLLKAVEIGPLKRFSIESDGYVHIAELGLSKYSPCTKRPGCRVVITTGQNGDSL